MKAIDPVIILIMIPSIILAAYFLYFLFNYINICLNKNHLLKDNIQ